MDKYYFYIEKERTRIFSNKSNGKPLEFIIDGINTTELYNTFRFDTSIDKCVICPLNRSYEQGYDNIYNYKVIIGGCQDLRAASFLEANHILSIINLLKIKEGEIRILYSYSFWKNQLEYNSVFPKDYYNNIFNIINYMLVFN